MFEQDAAGMAIAASNQAHAYRFRRTERGMVPASLRVDEVEHNILAFAAGNAGGIARNVMIS